MPFAPLDSASVIRTLWAPQPIYEPGNPRQYLGLSSVYDHQKRDKGKTAAQIRGARRAQQKYAWKRDVTNVLRATTSRYIWDYQAEALNLSDEEQEWEAEQEAVRTYGSAWLIPEGKCMNQEAEADDDAVHEEARTAATAAAAAAAQPGQPNDADASIDRTERANVTISTFDATASTTAEDATDLYDPDDQNDANARTNGSTGAGQPRRISRSGQREETVRQTAGGNRGGRRRSSRHSGQTSADITNNMSRRPSAIRESASPEIAINGVSTSNRGPPRAGQARHSAASSSGGGTGSAAFPRYGASAMLRTGSNIGALGASTGSLEVGGRDLNADISEAGETSYEIQRSASFDASGASMSGRFSRLRAAASHTTSRMPSAQRSSSPDPYLEDEDRENAEQEEDDPQGEEDMDLSN